MSALELPSRYTAWLTITRGCQLRCDWCYAKQTEYAVRMSDDVLRQSLEMLSGLNVKTVCLIGGEPTTDPRFLRIVRELSNRGYHVSVISNGIRFADERFLDSIIDAGIGNIIVSLKSATKMGYVRDTHKDAYAVVLRGLANLKARDNGKLKYTLSVTLCGSIVREFDEMIATIFESGATNVSFDTERPIIVNNGIQYDGLTPREIADLLVEAYPKMGLLKEGGINYYVYITHPFCLFPKWYIDTLTESGRLMSGCQMFGGTGIIIDEQGRILPCNHFCSSGLGSVDECKTGQGYISWRKQEPVIRFYERMTDYPTRQCETCPQWQICGAGCRINWFKFGQTELIAQ